MGYVSRAELISEEAQATSGPDHGRRVWHFRPPREGAFGRLLLENGLISAEFGVRDDLSDKFDPGEILDAVQEANRNEKPTRIRSMSSQLNALVNEMQPGDIVLCSLPGQRGIGFGLLEPDLLEDPEGRPARRVRWLRSPVPRSALLPDLLTATGALVPISEIARPGVMGRIRGLLQDGTDPGPIGQEGSRGASLEDLIRLEYDRIRDRIGAVFTGHAMADLVGALLRLDGLTVSVGRPGPDGGVDLIAGGGPLGLASPRLIGQVKSGLQVAGDETLQALLGTLQGSGADAVLLVSWSGVTRQALGRAAAMGFRVQIWDAQEVVRRFLDRYEDLPAKFRDKVQVTKTPLYRLGGA